MKKIVLVILLIIASISLFCQTKATVKMLNGDEIPCSLTTDVISIITDYGEIDFSTDFLKEIQFPEPGKGTTLLKTIYGELFRGFITNDSLLLNVYGKQMTIRKAKINKIEFQNLVKRAQNYKVTASLRNGDGFFGSIMTENITIQTSYGEVELPFNNMVQITFEGFGNVLTKVEMIDGGIVQGVIKDDYLPLTLLSNIELEVVPDLLKEVAFLKEELNVVEKNTAEEKEVDSFSTVDSFSSTKNKEIFSTPLGSEMILVQAGAFWMGNTRKSREDKELDTFEVNISYNFYIGITEVTNKEFLLFLNEVKPENRKDGYGSFLDGKQIITLVSSSCPYECISGEYILEKKSEIQNPAVMNWWGAVKFCNWLSEKEGLPLAYDDEGNMLDENGEIVIDPKFVKGYRLPTEAEWEYAARGGHNDIKDSTEMNDYQFAGSNNIDEVAWWQKSHLVGYSSKVGLKEPNELGLYDMTGNVSEWCFDFRGDYPLAYDNPVNTTESHGTRCSRGGHSNIMDYNGSIVKRYTGGITGLRIVKTAY